jgi:ACT domain-containing protein
MRVNVDIQLKDIPGQLIGALEPISKNDGNIRGVVHRHDIVSGGKIAINLTFEVGNQKSLDKILAEWKEKDVDVLKIDHLFETFKLDYVIVGELPPTEVRKIIEGIQAIGDVESIDIRYSVSGAKDKAALISGKVRNKEVIKKANKFINERAKRAGYIVIRGFGD